MRNKPHSSAKLCFSRPKMVTRLILVAKIGYFLPQNGDEIDSRRQNRAFFTSKWRRDRGSSPKSGIFHFKKVTRSGLVAKIGHFSLQKGDEIGARRQNRAFFTSKR
ncbi:hypothetical protein P9386_11980 [Caldifermentibacillus hisashii]|uniref:hypothetical protein n=1 Tax=Caldifermentibacillus hisashii TaxID=996558 RepID=UPI002E1D7D62|nr:hypothetical protein [Caldifermentibacillus hisashii]